MAMDLISGIGYQPVVQPLINSAADVSPFGKYTEHQLVVIGNGFDLSCGLKSRFADFFNPRANKIEEIDKGTEAGEERCAAYAEAGITVWDLILQAKRFVNDANWSDVEATIAEVVKSPENAVSSRNATNAWGDKIKSKAEKVNCQSLFVCLRDRALARGDAPDTTAFDSGHFRVDPMKLIINRETPVNNKICDYIEFLCPDIKVWSSGSLHRILLEQLHKLEFLLDRYLQKAQDAVPGYESYSASLLLRIIQYEFTPDEDIDNEVTILDFNYTVPTNPTRFIHDIKDMVNVHGRLGEKIVVGIDATDCLNDKASIRFTKTYRLMESQQMSWYGQLAFPQEHSFPSKETVAIKFFGHSLAEADYAYFQSIFDIVDLYNGITKLYFFYQTFEGFDLEQFCINVMNLLAAYGKTLDNKEYGKNLIHKLLLEGRLHIADIG